MLTYLDDRVALLRIASLALPTTWFAALNSRRALFSGTADDGVMSVVVVVDIIVQL